jgi:hypothetical protein
MRDNPWARARRLAGNSSAAALLLRLYYWHDKTTYREDGRNWLGLSRKMWTEELFFSLDEYKNALARVKKESLVVVKRKEIGGLQRAWIALSDRALEVLTRLTGVKRHRWTGVIRHQAGVKRHRRRVIRHQCNGVIRRHSYTKRKKKNEIKNEKIK